MYVGMDIPMRIRIFEETGDWTLSMRAACSIAWSVDSCTSNARTLNREKQSLCRKPRNRSATSGCSMYLNTSGETRHDRSHRLGDSSCRPDSRRRSTSTLSCTNCPVLGSSADIVILQDASDVPRRLTESVIFLEVEKSPLLAVKPRSPPHALVPGVAFQG